MSKFLPEGKLIDTAENAAAMANAAALSKAMSEHKLLEARAVICDSHHNLIVDLGCMKGVIMREEGAKGIADGSVRDIAIISRVGKPVCFFVKKIMTDSHGMPFALLSRRQAQEACEEQYISKLRSGDIIDATVTHLEPFGAFVDIGCGIPSLISIDLISVSRISHPSDRFTIGIDIKAVVKSVEEKNRIVLSHRELMGTWMENAQLFNVGETVTGIVRSVEDYGIFIEITPNLVGLAERRDGVAVGSYASVYIKSIIPDKMKIKLVLVDTFRSDAPPKKPRYFFCGDHMDCFCYSPCDSERVIETIFD
ncbi:MAG: S1 RNA-binding domain-containing protein [Oscillospiraceae bacterium]|jgi:small subunit ribosomal protein S1|nr:S1 RNA-binding domain-containing protein [Oscillospiraceae bacterium]